MLCYLDEEHPPEAQLTGTLFVYFIFLYSCCMISDIGIRERFQQKNAHERLVLTISGYNPAAVLVPIISANHKVQLLFTKRTNTVETHKGQISFPGGMVDSSDADIVYTALREAHEEIGLPPDSVEVLGVLDDMATPSGFVITPVVGMIGSLPDLRLNCEEVAEVFRVDFDFFSSGLNGRTEMREVRGRMHELWFYEWGEHCIWGATAMMIRSLLKKLELI